MIKLTTVTEDNWGEIASLSVKDNQKDYLAPAIGILARGYVYRNCNPKIFVIENDDVIVGVALVREFGEEPLGYDLQQFMIDKRYQGKGYGISIEVNSLQPLNALSSIEVTLDGMRTDVNPLQS